MNWHKEWKPLALIVGFGVFVSQQSHGTEA